MRLNVSDITMGLVLKWNAGNWDTFMPNSSREDWKELVFCLFFSENVNVIYFYASCFYTCQLKRLWLQLC